MLKLTRKIIAMTCLILLTWSIMMIGGSRSEFPNMNLTNESEDPHFAIEALPKANFTGVYSCYAYDEDSDGIFEELHVTVEISVHELGRFQVNGWIMNPDTYEDHHFSSEPRTFTSLGIYDLLFTIPGTWIWSQHTTTSYIIDYIYLLELDEYNDSLAEWDYAYSPYTTITCNSDEFITPSAYFTGNFIASLIDTDAPVDGLADFLAIDMEVQVEDEIDLEIQVELDLETGNHWNYEYYYDLSAGFHLLRMKFPGQIFYLTAETRNYTFNFRLMDTSEWEQIDSYYDFQTPFFNYQDFTPPGASFTGNIYDQGIDTDSDGTYNHVKLEIELDVVKSGLFRIAGFIQSDDGWDTDYFDTDLTLLEVGTQIVSIELDRHFFYSQTSGSPVFISELYLSEYLENYGDLEIEYISTQIYLSKNYYHSDFDPQNARIIEIIDDHGVDFDLDGKYDVLRLVFSLEVTVEWIDLELVAELQTNSTGELYTGKSSRYYGITAGMYEIFLDFPCHELSFSGFNDTLVISHYQLYQLNKDYQLLDIEHEDLILTGKFTYLNFSSIEPNMIEILGIWPGSGSVYTTDSWIGVGIEFRKFGSAEAASVDMIAYLEGTPHSITFNQKDDYGAEEYWYFDLHLDEAGIWFIEVEITNTNGPSTFGRVIVLVSSPSVLNEISLSYPSLITGGTVQVTVDVWDSNGIDSVYLWVDDFSKTPRVQMLKVGVSSTGEIYSADLTFNEIGEFWIYFEAINSLGLSTHLGSESILILDEPEILSVDVSPSRYVEPRTDMIVEVNILKSNVPINDVLLTLVDADMESIEYPMSFQSETDRIETYKVEFSLKHKGKYECLVEVSNLDGQTSSYTLTITVEGEDATITPAFEYLFFIGSLMLLIIKRKLHD